MFKIKSLEDNPSYKKTEGSYIDKNGIERHQLAYHFVGPDSTPTALEAKCDWKFAPIEPVSKDWIVNLTKDSV